MLTEWPELHKTAPDGQPASFRGVPFHVISDTPDRSHAPAIYEYPDRPGAVVKDQARGASRFRLTAVFFGDTYRDSERFKAALDETGPGDLVHPVWGTMEVVVGQVSGPRHSADRRRYCEFDVEFILHEPTPQELRLLPGRSPKGLHDVVVQGMEDAVKEAKKKVEQAARQAKEGPLGVLKQVRDSFSKIARQVEAFAALSDLLLSGDVVGLADALADQIFELPEGVGGWIDAPTEWCDAVDRSMIARAQQTLSLGGSAASRLGLFAAEAKLLHDSVVDLLGQAAKTGPAKPLADYVRLAGASTSVAAAAEILLADLAVLDRNPYTGPTIGITAQEPEVRPWA